MIKLREHLNNWLTLKSWRPYFIIFLVGFLLYGQTLFFSYTYYDDNELTLERTAFLQDFRNIPQIFSTDVFLSAAGDKFYYRPLLNLSFMADAHLGGEVPFFYHFSNILIHIIAVFLLFYFLKKIIKKDSLAFFFSLIFLVHPVLTQAVAWIPGRNDSLLAVFVLAAFITFLNFLENPRLRSYLLYLLFFLLAILTKETALFLIVLVIFYFLFIDSGKITRSDKFLLIFGSVGISFIWFLMRTLALGGEPIDYVSSIWGIINSSGALLVDLGKIILPFNLSVLPILADSTIIYGLIVFLILVAALFFSRQKKLNLIIFGALWFLIFLLPSFIRPNGVPDFLEHRLYLSLIGFLIVLSEIDWLKKLDFNDKKVKLVSLLIILFFAVLTLIHSVSFRDRLTFWQRAVKDSPHSALAQRNLGAMYYLDGKLDLAAKYYRVALEISPYEPMVHNNLGLIYFEQGSYGQAEKEYLQELKYYPTYDRALYNLGELYYRENRLTEAADLWRAALRINPNYYEPYQGLLNLTNKIR